MCVLVKKVSCAIKPCVMVLKYRKLKIYRYLPTLGNMRCHVDVSVKRGYGTCIFKLFYFTVVGLNNLVEHE